MTTQGAWVWYDLMTPDTAAAQDFYTNVVGWTAIDSGMPGQAYTLFKAGERPAAGMTTLTQEARDMGAPPSWLGHVAVGDVDAVAAGFEKDGGVVRMAPQDIPGIGRFAIVADPQGAVLSLFKGLGETPPLAAGAPGHVGWHELMTTDVEAAFAFYAKHFGWTKAEAIDMGEMGVYQLFAHDGVAIGGMMKRPPHAPVSNWGFYFSVPAVHPAADKVKAGGGQVLNGPMPVPGGSWVVQCRDPQGVYFNLAAPL